MSTDKQIAANRHNAKLGGPKTESGKAVSRYNSLKHGLTSQQVVGPEEDSEIYDQYREAIWAEKQPVGVLEEELVDIIAASSWRMRRGLKIEQGDLKHFADKKSRVSTPNIASWQNLVRYEASHSRQFYKAINELEKLQNARRGKPPTLPSIKYKEEFPSMDLKMGLLPKLSFTYHSASTNWMGKFLTTSQFNPPV